MSADGNRLLVKIGGTLLDDPAHRGRLAKELAGIRDRQIVLVHGGGKQMTRFLDERGVQSEFVEGLRVTTPEVIDAVLKVVGGTVNHELVAALVACGAPAVGLSGLDAGLVAATVLRPELGLVGKPVRSDGALLNHLCSGGYLPVVACIAGDGAGTIFNVNADQLAVACAVGFAAKTLVFLTDVDGVKDSSGRVRPSLSAKEAQAMMDNGVATGGMMAKLRACLQALESGIEEVVIAPGALEGVIRRLEGGEMAGTRISRSGLN